MSWHASSGYAETLILFTSGKWEWWLLGGLTTQGEVTCTNLSQAFIGSRALSKHVREKSMNLCKPQLSKAAFFASTHRIRLQAHVRTNECVCVSAWKNVKGTHQCLNPATKPIHESHMIRVWFPLEEGGFRGKVLWGKTLSVEPSTNGSSAWVNTLNVKNICTYVLTFLRP